MKDQCIFVDLLQRVNYYTWGVRLRESVNKRKIQFSFSKVSASAYERVSSYGNVEIPECHWEVKRGFEKASIKMSRAVHLRVSVSRELTVFIFESNLDRSSRHSRLLEMNMSFFKQRLLCKQV